MNREDYLKLNSYEELKNSIPKFIEVFVNYYGEDKRDIIEKKFNNALFIGYTTLMDRSNAINNIKIEKSNELIDEILDGVDIGLTKEELFGNKTSYDNKILFFLNQYMKLIELYKSEVKSEDFIRKFNSCKPILDRISPNITPETFNPESNELSNLNILLERYIKSLDKYDTFLNENKDTFSEIEQNNQLKRKTEEKYYKLYLKDILEYIEEQDKDVVIKYINGECESHRLPENVKKIFGTSISSISFLLNAFSLENENKLKDANSSSWAKESIINDRIKYFKLKGFNLGDDYSVYLNNEEIKKIWPSYDFVNQIINKRNMINDLCEQEFLSSVAFYQKIQSDVSSKHYLDADGIFKTDYIKNFNTTTCVQPNLVKNENGCEMSPLVLISFGCASNGTLDHNIIHELNHLFELTLEGYDDKNYTCKCGWDILVGDLNNENLNSKYDQMLSLLGKEEKRDYELLNEIINEMIAQEIETEMHKNNIYIFDSEEKSKVKNATSYEHTFFLIQDFYNEFKKEIMDSRFDMNALFDVVGKENFDELNSLFNIYNASFGGLKVYNIYKSLNNHEDNEDTRLYFQLRDKSREIVERMKQERDKQVDMSYAS